MSLTDLQVTNINACLLQATETLLKAPTAENLQKAYVIRNETVAVLDDYQLLGLREITAAIRIAKAELHGRPLHSAKIFIFPSAEQRAAMKQNQSHSR
ncbi:MAG: hypothetical protein WAZ18_01140 [Alphaproteobacteria bacterium]